MIGLQYMQPVDSTRNLHTPKFVQKQNLSIQVQVRSTDVDDIKDVTEDAVECVWNKLTFNVSVEDRLVDHGRQLVH